MCPATSSLSLSTWPITTTLTGRPPRRHSTASSTISVAAANQRRGSRLFLSNSYWDNLRAVSSMNVSVSTTTVAHMPDRTSSYTEAKRRQKPRYAVGRYTPFESTSVSGKYSTRASRRSDFREVTTVCRGASASASTSSQRPSSRYGASLPSGSNANTRIGLGNVAANVDLPAPYAP